MNQTPGPRPEIANESMSRFNDVRPAGPFRTADPSIQPAGERPRTVLGQAYQDVAARSAEERTARAEQRLQEWRRPRDE